MQKMLKMHKITRKKVNKQYFISLNMILQRRLTSKSCRKKQFINPGKSGTVLQNLGEATFTMKHFLKRSNISPPW